MLSKGDLWQAHGRCTYMCIHMYLQTHNGEKRIQNPNKVTAGRNILHVMSQETRAIGPGAGIPENLFEQPYYALHVFHI